MGHPKIKKAPKTKNLFECELEKRKYEEHIREKFANVSQSPSFVNVNGDCSSAAANENFNIPILIKEENKNIFEKNMIGQMSHTEKENKDLFKQDGNCLIFPKKRKSVHHIR